MGINQTHIKNLERKIYDYNSNLTLFEQQFIIIPYYASGYIDYSNFGYVDGQYQIDNFETYKRIWTGNDSFIITWKDSTSIKNDQTQKKVVYDYKIGEVLLGWLENNSSNNDVSTDQSFEYYKSQTSEQSLTFRINASRFNLDTNYEFLFYKVPEYSKDVLYRVVSIEKEYVGKELMCYVLNLKALNQDLSNTGLAKQQNVMPNAPGQGNITPLITTEYQSNEGDVEGVNFIKIDNRYVVVNRQKQLNRPVKKVVVKAFGLCVFSNIAFWGRRAIRGDNSKNFGLPRWIFPINLVPATTPTLYRTQTSEVNYYWMSNSVPTIRFSKETFDAIKSMFKVDAIWPSQGFLTVDVSNTQATNPVVSGMGGNSYSYQLFGVKKATQGRVEFEPWLIDLKTNKEYRTDVIYGCTQTYTVPQINKLHDLMFHSFWVQKKAITLPVTSKNTLSFGWNVGSSLAALVTHSWTSASALLTIGITGTVIQRGEKPYLEGFSGFIPASIFDFMKDETNGIYSDYASLNNNHVKLSYFENFENDNEINKFFNTQTLCTAFEAELTDVLEVDGNVMTRKRNETCGIGQEKWEDDTYVKNDKKPWLLDGKTKLLPLQSDVEKDVGFIIDAFQIEAMFKGDYSVEFLDSNDDVVWSGVYQSQGKWTGSIRETKTWINTSIYGRENIFVEKPIEWPKEVPPLDLVGYTKPDVIEIDFRAQEKGKVLDLYSVYNHTGFNFRQILQDRDKLSLAWRETIGDSTYRFRQNIGYSTLLKFEGEVLLKDNYITNADKFVDEFSHLEINFESHCLSPFVGSKIFKINTKSFLKRNDGSLWYQTWNVRMLPPKHNNPFFAHHVPHYGSSARTIYEIYGNYNRDGLNQGMGYDLEIELSFANNRLVAKFRWDISINFEPLSEFRITNLREIVNPGATISPAASFLHTGYDNRPNGGLEQFLKRPINQNVVGRPQGYLPQIGMYIRNIKVVPYDIHKPTPGP